MREYQARFCEGLGVKLPGSTRRPGTSFPYHVEGRAYAGTIELFGAAAVVDPRLCAIVGYRPDSDNAHIVFRFVQALTGAIAPPPAIDPPSRSQDQAQWREDLKRQGREFCRQYPADHVCNSGNGHP